MHYVGRFAPSPTGPLHMGSLYAAVCSFLDAKANSGLWYLRIEDIDPPREQAGATHRIIESLRAHGLNWDGKILYQSERSQLYESALQQLIQNNACFACPCSRKDLSSLGRHTDACPLNLEAPTPKAHALRMAHSDKVFSWDDLFLGQQSFREEAEAVLKRKDGLYAYQLAVVVDDIAQGITHVIRGRDLLECTPTQLHLFKLLDKTAPSYGHIPLIINAEGQKLSKQNLAPAIDSKEAISNLKQIGNWLNFDTQQSYSTPEQMLEDFVRQWSRTTVGHKDLRGS